MPNLQCSQHLIITVGTSLLGNLARAGHQSALDNQDLVSLSKAMNVWQPEQREAGAELNSTFQLLRQGKVAERPQLHLLVSETPSGNLVGKLLMDFLKTRHYQTQAHLIEGLQDQDPDRFGREGLRNLVRLCGQIIQQAGGSEFVALNATGGYKAQIAVAALIGSALHIPVYYKHELFNQVIGFPPMPISLDDTLIERHLGYLLAAEEDTLNTAPPDPALLTLLDSVNIDTQTAYALSPLGQICLTSYTQRYPQKHHLPPAATTDQRKKPRLRDDHYPLGFEAYVDKVFNETPYMTHVVSLPYDRQPCIRDRYFYAQLSDPEILVAEYLDKNGFGARFRILSTARTQRQRQAILRDLFYRYGRSKV